MFSYSLSFLAYQYQRLNDTGDIVRYKIAFNDVTSSSSLFEVFSDVYNLFYTGWNLILYTIGSLNLPFEAVNFVFVFLYYYFITLIIIKSSSTKKEFIFGLIFSILLFSIPVIFTTYRNQAAFVILIYGLFYLRGYMKVVSSFIAVSLHPASVLILAVYIFQRFIKYNIKFIPIFLIAGLLIKPAIQSLSFILLSVPFVGGKIEVYILGVWSQYNLSKMSVLLMIVNISFMILAIIFSLYKIKEKKEEVYFSQKYFLVSLLLLSFFTIAQRYIWFCFPLYIPLFINGFKDSNFRDKTILVFLLLGTVDVRWFTMLYNNSFIIGDGFPMNILSNVFDVFKLGIF
nr:EpsG family protein [Photobacterium leiognathi]